MARPTFDTLRTKALRKRGVKAQYDALRQALVRVRQVFDAPAPGCNTMCITGLIGSYAMATRTVRLDDEAERVLASLTSSTGLSISEVLKRGLMAYKEQVQNTPARHAPYEVFRQLDLGPGGYALAAAKDAKVAIRATIARKHHK